MAKKVLNDTKNENIRRVKLWIGSFIPMMIASVLFVFCFIFEHELWLYVLCTVVFLTFVFLYVRADKAIRREEGFTLVQAMHFYLKCLNAGVNDSVHGAKLRKVITEASKKIEYAKGLNAGEVDSMYKIGKELIKHFKFERFRKYV